VWIPTPPYGLADFLDVVHPSDRPRIQALLGWVAEHPELVPQEGLTFELSVISPKGFIRDIRACGQVVHDSDGQPARWVGVLQDITQQRLSEQELAAHYALTVALRDWVCFEEGVSGLLARLGAALEHPMGALWLWDPCQERLVCRAFWRRADIDAEPFEAATRRRTLRPGEGGPGVVWQTRQPVTADPIAKRGLDLHHAAFDAGVTSAVSFAAVGPDGPIAVLSFYSFDRRVASASLVRTLTAIGEQLGVFLSRRSAQLTPGPLTQRELEVLRCAAQGSGGPQIARQLTISPATVKTHLEHIYDKLGVSDRAAAVAHGLRTGLIE
jgi:DNA-binding CsgD family transcriptional regulator